MAVKRGEGPSIPRNNSGEDGVLHVNRPSSERTGCPSCHCSSRASALSASALRAAWSLRNASARSSPAPLKKGSGGKSVVRSKRNLHGFAVQGWKARLAKPIDRMPPALVIGLTAADDVKVERKMRENVVHGGDGGQVRRRFLGPLASRQSGHAAEEALCRTAHQPHRAAALDPPGGAMPVRPCAALQFLRIGVRIPGRESGTFAAERAFVAARALRPA